jgi:hypothetical protein
MKKLLLLTTLFLAFACSKDEADDDNSNENQTFLEKYDGMGFKISDYEYYFYFFDDTFFMASVDGEGGDFYCMKFKEGENILEEDYPPVLMSIKRNDEDALIYELSYREDGSLYKETGKFTVNAAGNELTIIMDEGTDDEDFDTYYKTNSSYSSLCN